MYDLDVKRQFEFYQKLRIDLDWFITVKIRTRDLCFNRFWEGEKFRYLCNFVHPHWIQVYKRTSKIPPNFHM